MKRLTRLLPAAAMVGLVLAASTPRAALAQARLYVNTTEDLPPDDAHCLPGKICPLRSAIEKAESFSGGAVVTACYDRTLVPKAAPCRGPGAKPLDAADPGYDPETNKWILRLKPASIPFDFTENGTKIDFRLGVDPWTSPADDHFVIEAGGGTHQFAFKIQSRDNQIAGVEIRGEYSESAILLQQDFFGNGAVNNVIGPGNILAGITSGNGIKIKDAASVGNAVVGNWCGITGDGTEIAPVAEDCIYVLDDTSQNRIGGDDPGDRNVLAASHLGVGVKIEGAGTRDNSVLGNWIGVDGSGTRPGQIQTGVLVVDAFRTRVTGNHVAGTVVDGIAFFGAAGEGRIEANRVGIDASGACLGNRAHGIALQHGPFDSVVARNEVRCNGAGGILLTGAATRDIQLTENLITANEGHAINVVQGANRGLRPPAVQRHDARSIAGTTCPGCVVEIFSDPNGQAAAFEGRVTAEAATGTWSFELPAGTFRHRTLSTTATKGRETSELSPFVILAGATPTPGRPEATPTPGGTGPVLFAGVVYLPWAGRAAWPAR